MPYAKLRILIADDVKETRRSTRMMLSINPDVIVVAIAKNGANAVELANQHRPDIAIIDINMPEMDGLSAYKKMLEVQPDLACIIISAEHDHQSLRNAMSVGAREYLIKPFTVDELNTAVLKVSQIVKGNRRRKSRADRLRKQRTAYLKRLAQEYARSRRTDDQALEVFEHLARDPQCERRWLMNLAMVYVIRKKWGKLRDLASRLEYQEKKQKQQNQ
jgi:YesN/AraC family two-component response regulator